MKMRTIHFSALALILAIASVPVASETKADVINRLANDYDKLQYAYESCAQRQDISDRHHDFTMAVPDAEQDAAIQAYVDATAYVAQAVNACEQDPTNPPEECWGFWPPDTAGDLHWKMMPCDE